MASAKMKRAAAMTEPDMKMDMSSMIDLVFLLLIFFMVSSHLIIVQIDRNVEPPEATNGTLVESAQGRIVINVYDNGDVFAANKEELGSTAAITDYIQVLADRIRPDGITPVLHVRAHHSTATREVKRVITAAGEAGVNEVIFSAYKLQK